MIRFTLSTRLAKYCTETDCESTQKSTVFATSTTNCGPTQVAGMVGWSPPDDWPKSLKRSDASLRHDDWNEGDDPYNEHDFGKLDVDGETVIWKIDYYSLDEMHGSDYPEDPNMTIRILTLMFAEDY